MKLDTRSAMQVLLAEIRAAIPFDLPEADICSADCRGCSKKLLEFLEMEVQGWELRLDRGDKPDFGDLNGLAKSARKIYNALSRSGLVPPHQQQ